jgi:CSLREA domain-containing protein
VRVIAVAAVWLAWAPVASAANFVVNSTVDGIDANVGDGTCLSSAAGGGCTLRAAIQEANAAGGASTVAVPAGRYRLSIAPLIAAGSLADIDAGNGDLDISGELTVSGAGAAATIIDGAGLDRVFSVGNLGNAQLRDMTITGADSTGGGTSQEIDLGGGILNQGSILVERVALVDNLADGGGGMFSIPGTTPVVRDSLIAGNRAYSGGGLRLDAGGQIVNTTITGNTLLKLPPGETTRKPVSLVVPLVDEISGWGGGIDNRGGGDVTIVNSTITGNHALKGGGGLAAGQGYAPVSEQVALGRMTLRNTIVAGNTSDAGPVNCHVKDQVIASLGHNLDTDGSCFLTAQGDRPKTDPLLEPLADNGGPTWTRALRAGSHAIDAGGAEGCPAHDQRGIHRPFGAACDIGAFEYVPAIPSAAPRRRCTIVVRLPARLRAQARYFDVVLRSGVAARRRRPRSSVRVRVPAASPRRVTVVLRVRLRSGRRTSQRVAARTTCRG